MRGSVSNSVCAVRYVDTVYFGSVVRFGFKSKSGMITDMYKPVSLQQGRRAKGLVFMFAWLEAVPGTSDRFVYTGDSTLDEGTGTLSYIVHYVHRESGTQLPLIMTIPLSLVVLF